MNFETFKIVLEQFTNDSMDRYSPSYTAGYLQSVLEYTFRHLPAAQQAELIEQFTNQLTSWQLKEIA